MAYFVTSDSHFNNENIIKYCNRPFISSKHQTAELINSWNSVVGPEDTVFHLGDFIMGAADKIPKLLSQLNGSIILAQGNHDTPKKLEIYAEHHNKITVAPLHYLHYKKLFFVFCHFPMTNEDFLKMVKEDNSEVVFCHGHVHDKAPFFNPEHNTFNCCVDVTYFTPVSLDRIHKLVKDNFIAKGVWHGKEI